MALQSIYLIGFLIFKYFLFCGNSFVRGLFIPFELIKTHVIEFTLFIIFPLFKNTSIATHHIGYMSCNIGSFFILDIFLVNIYSG